MLINQISKCVLRELNKISIRSTQPILGAHRLNRSSSILNVKYNENDSVDDEIRQGIIKIPLKLQKRLDRDFTEKKMKIYERERMIEESRQGNRNKIVIHCKRQDFNHYSKQNYGKKDLVPLASKGWGHHKSKGDFFTIKPQSERMMLVEDAEGNKGKFEDLEINKDIIEQLIKKGHKCPTYIQSFGIPPILEGKSCVLSADTGSGKTLAFLIPLVQKILLEKRLRHKRKANQPLVIILTPTRELMQQIHQVAIDTFGDLGVRMKMLTSGNIGAKIGDPSVSNIDLLVTTPYIFEILHKFKVYDITRTKHIVVDEVDSLLDDSFSEETLDILRKFPIGDYPDMSQRTQLILVGATLPTDLDNTLEKLEIEDCVRIETPETNTILSNITHNFYRVKKSEKHLKLLDLLRVDAEQKNPVIIFCNRKETCNWLSLFLPDNDIKCISLFGKMDISDRKGLLDFYQLGQTDVLISTDLTSRGIDTIRTKHVINYEFPRYIADYIHRSGRTGRLGSAKGCKISNFVSWASEVQLVNDIEMAVRKEKKFQDVEPNIKKLWNAKYGNFQPIEP